MPDIEALQAEWKSLYSETLPKLAKSRDSAQQKWPVTLDHCFARIILDNVIGDGKQQWDKLLAKPAVRNMDEQQLQAAIALGLKIIAGEADLCRLDETSLQCRGKNEAKYKKSTVKGAQKSDKQSSSAARRKRPADNGEDSNDMSPRKHRKTDENQSTLDFWQSQTTKIEPDSTNRKPPQAREQQPHHAELLRLVERVHTHSSLTPYRKKLYTILLSVPRGRYTTYAAMSDHLKSSARAVGNGMRNNPFAPDVPCHRVLAADGSIGGFHGDWGKDGAHAAKKIELLRGEGVKFDARGKVVGEPFRKFHHFQEPEDGNLA